MTNLRTPGRPALAIALLVCSLAAPAALDSAPLSVEAAMELAVRTDASIPTLQRRLDDQLDELGWGPYRDAFTLKLAGSLAGRPEQDLSAGGSAVLSAGLQILPQLQISGSLTARVTNTPDAPGTPDPLSGKVGLVLTPLADAYRRSRDELAVESTLLSIDTRVSAVSYAAVAQLLSAMEADRELGMARTRAELALRSLESTQALAARDRATEQQLRNASDALRSAEQAVARGELAALRTLDELSRLLRMPVTDAELPGYSFAVEAVDRVAAARPSLAAESIADASPDVLKAQIDAEAAGIERAAARRFNPGVKITAEIGAPESAYSLGAEITLSAAAWDGRALAEADADLAAAEAALDAARRKALFAARSALLEFDIALANLDAERTSLGYAERALAEARFRFDRGDITALAVDQAVQSLAEGHARVDYAAAGVVRRWYALQLYQ